MRLSVPGLALDVPPGWEARVRRRPAGQADRAGPLLLHACTRAMPSERGDFGSGVVDTLGADDVFVALAEYEPEDRDTALFAARGFPRVRPAEFRTNGMQRPLPGQSGGQWFFTHAGRPFCLFVVLGSHGRRAAGAARANDLLAALTVEKP